MDTDTGTRSIVARVRSGWHELSRPEKVTVALLAPFATTAGFLVGFFAMIFLLASVPV